uniref:F-box domain-containing protein n=1 Tax=Setaria italica TaxID=4555 RepID=K4AIK1_SETIT
MEEFQDDALREISRHLPCVADRDDAADVCRRWQAALSEPLPDPPLPRQLPWLLLPSADSTRACCLFCGTGNDACVIRHKLTATHGARCFGSYNGHCPNRDARFLYLPDALGTGLNHGQRDMVILAATLSCSPDDQNCIGAGIVMQWQFIAGQRQAPFEVEDVLFHDGS